MHIKFQVHFFWYQTCKYKGKLSLNIHVHNNYARILSWNIHVHNKTIIKHSGTNINHYIHVQFTCTKGSMYIGILWWKCTLELNYNLFVNIRILPIKHSCTYKYYHEIFMYTQTVTVSKYKPILHFGNIEIFVKLNFWNNY